MAAGPPRLVADDVLGALLAAALAAAWDSAGRAGDS